MSKKEQARTELQQIEPKIDFLHEILGIGLFAEITQTSDGYFLGREKDDIGFNAFLGKPSENALARTKTFLSQMTDASRVYCINLLEQFSVRV